MNAFHRRIISQLSLAYRLRVKRTLAYRLRVKRVSRVSIYSFCGDLPAALAVALGLDGWRAMNSRNCNSRNAHSG